MNFITMSFKLIAVFFLSSFCLQACADTTESTNTENFSSEGSNEDELAVQNAAWKTLKDSLYTIQYPETWEMNYTGQKGLSFVAVSPLANPDDLFRENLSLIIQDMNADDSSLKDFAEDNTNQIVDMIVDGKVVKNEEITEKGTTYR